MRSQKPLKSETLLWWLRDRIMFPQLDHVSPSSLLFRRIQVTMCFMNLLVDLIYLGHFGDMGIIS